MHERHLAGVAAVANVVHPAYPEDATVFAERLRLYPDGSLVFEDADGEGVSAYVVSHPWRANDPPVLNQLLGELPARPATYYIHDLALLPRLRGLGVASAVVSRLIATATAAKLPTVSLIAVNGSAGFWRRHGFQDITDIALAQKLRSYDADARFMMRTL